ncbi:MAG: alpha/beta hydrolase [Pseudomonadales bacterium]|nr:alpha/beta hydrolase [Pseudomonadales bacterium]
MPPVFQLTEYTHHIANRRIHTRTSGPTDGPLIIFVHGWPELSLSWRHQLPVLGALGFHAVAPDMRGYGNSSVYARHEDYAQELVVGDMLALLDALGRDKAIWVGHDWGSPTVWNIASHHPDRCHGVASLCVPYFTLERGLEHAISLVDRAVYPADQYPAGQWDYQLFYLEDFQKATQTFEANTRNTVQLLFRKGDPAGQGKPAATASTRANGGWFGPLDAAPEVPIDTDVVSETDVEIYAESLSRNGFFGPDSYYMNHQANAAYAASAVNDGRLDLPVLYLAARYDYVCESVRSGAAAPMREMCSDLDELIIDSGHWMAQERPVEVNSALVSWLARKLPDVWPKPGK